MLMGAAQTAEELSESATSRGIEHPGKRSSWRPIGFHIQDVVVCLAFAAPVSYTHLDVYKRQGQPLRQCMGQQQLDGVDVVNEHLLQGAHALLLDHAQGLPLQLSLEGSCLLYTSRCV